MRVLAAILACALGIPAFASDAAKVSLGEVAESAVQQSKLTLPGSTPFHLKAEIEPPTGTPRRDRRDDEPEFGVPGEG